jgi:hypothetical protein
MRRCRTPTATCPSLVSVQKCWHHDGVDRKLAVIYATIVSQKGCAIVTSSPKLDHMAIFSWFSLAINPSKPARTLRH